jgi:hypothetical protein
MQHRQRRSLKYHNREGTQRAALIKIEITNKNGECTGESARVTGSLPCQAGDEEKANLPKGPLCLHYVTDQRSE